MTSKEQLEIDRFVCFGLGKLPGESIEQRARLCLRYCKVRRLRAAQVLLDLDHGPIDPWERMRRAAAILRGLELVQGGAS